MPPLLRCLVELISCLAEPPCLGSFLGEMDWRTELAMQFETILEPKK